MTKTRRLLGLLGLLVAAGLLTGGGVAVADEGEAGPGRGVADEGEADLAHHGRVVYEDGRLALHLRTWNHGPASLAAGAVQLSFSTPVAGPLPGTCVRRAPAILLCETGPLRAGAPAPGSLELALRVPGAPDELWLDIQTARPGTTRDLNPANDHQRVLALATGDPYYF
ncbi:hypothetical protein GCM10010329_08420 [Streptomyces spiroverticillatus]|uniref:DUF11 domain-containing protein n=1 Tax=Streptomyces finlayi TaxID=67296 RepID=A0A918WT70_9ACTN|nr:hypothetical protein [Streptomyces finlayi]GGZ90131.1 hypothetical protein GCM10010329_08420 [Streptomyces spiroverticillatus]GHC80976.1 hypothetical protein GCM10010334_08410 [Streptomyces finlayi]